MTILEQPTSAQVAMQFDSPAEWDFGIAKAIVEQTGGIAAFNIVLDVVPLGIPLTSITGFKEANDTLGFFLANKEPLISLMKAIAMEEGKTPEHYFMTLDETLDLPTAKEIYRILSAPALLGTCKARVAAAYYGLIHEVAIQVVLKVIEDINARRDGFPF